MPAREPIDLDGKDFDLMPVAQFVDALAEPGYDLENAGAECLDAVCAKAVK